MTLCDGPPVYVNWFSVGCWWGCLIISANVLHFKLVYVWVIGVTRGD